METFTSSRGCQFDRLLYPSDPIQSSQNLVDFLFTDFQEDKPVIKTTDRFFLANEILSDEA